MIRDFKISDIYELTVQDKQYHYKEHITKIAEAGGLDSVRSYIENGEVKAIIGAQPYWQGRSTIWSLIGNVESWPKFHKQAVKTINDYVKTHNVLRLELTTEAGFIESERWAEMLGFKFESLMPKFGVDGRDHKMWVVLWQQQ